MSSYTKKSDVGYQVNKGKILNTIKTTKYLGITDAEVKPGDSIIHLNSQLTGKVLIFVK